MEINDMRAFFKWCTIINGSLLVFWSLLIRCAGGWVFGFHHQWIPIASDAFPVAIYLLLGFFKIIVIAFNLVPYIALVIIGRNHVSGRSSAPAPTR